MMTTVQAVEIPFAGKSLSGALNVPQNSRGTILIECGNLSAASDPSCAIVAEVLVARGFGTLLLDPLTAVEHRLDAEGGRYKHNVPLLAERVGDAVRWLKQDRHAQGLPIGVLAEGVGAAAALLASTDVDRPIRAIVCWEGRPDLVKDALGTVTTPTLFAVGEFDQDLQFENGEAWRTIRTQDKLLRTIHEPIHEGDRISAVAEIAAQWFAQHFGEDQPAWPGPHAKATLR